ncbi:PREDICTED: F-box protein ETP1-like [Camelina sativa]|uniref:F-box protein ETP1-like n=1 Tax=Camelina sativa TaxID=90675 RepID=A0ABM0YWC2_CAMSA|nr:PREDICTED: F-box protein ETP1-like [Camelina sativa]
MAIPELANDLVDEILCCLPATSLKRLRATCKRWNRLFKEDRKFASEHRDKAAKEFLFLIMTEKQRICPLSIINLAPQHGDDVTPLPSVEVKRELSLPHPRSNNIRQFDMTTQVFHCDGLLLCVRDLITGPTACHYEIVVWNPFTGQTRWIEADNRWNPFITFVLGYNNNKSSCSQRILCFDPAGKETEIYDLNSSDSWRTLDDDLTPPGWTAVIAEDFTSLKGNIYFFAKEESEPQLGLSLLRFDFSTEKSSLFVPLPYQRPRWEILRLSAVRDEKLSVFLQPADTSKAEIWVTSKIDDDSTKAVSWNKVLAFDLNPHLQITEHVTFVLDEDKKVAVCCERLMDYDDDLCIDKIYILGQDNQGSEFGFDPLVPYQTGPRPVPLNYVPSLVQIELPAGD